MTWICVDCSTPENLGAAGGEQIVIDAVCHHCGRPVCRKNRYLLVDEPLSAAPGATAARTFHCKKCYHLHHDRAPYIDESTGLAAVRR